jgi:hypothetical protein
MGPDGPTGPVGLATPTSQQCQALWTVSQLPRPWWIDAPPSTCVTDPMHQPPQAYDVCGDIRSRAAGYDPRACNLPEVGLWVCDSDVVSGAEWLTQTCLKSTDCPEGMACTTGARPIEQDPDAMQFGLQGVCAQRCDASVASSCVLCALGCNMYGLCAPKAPDYGPCTTSCECPPGIRCNASTGRCDQSQPGDLVPDCGPSSTWCPCNGGTCQGRCCYKSDGTIATYSDPECAPATP